MDCRLPLLLLAFAALGGCGQSGPLYFRADPPLDQLPPSKRMQAAASQAAPVAITPVPAATTAQEKAPVAAPVAPASGAAASQTDADKKDDAAPSPASKQDNTSPQ